MYPVEKINGKKGSIFIDIKIVYHCGSIYDGIIQCWFETWMSDFANLKNDGWKFLENIFAVFFTVNFHWVFHFFFFKK
jgi:hypothetical protein